MHHCDSVVENFSDIICTEEEREKVAKVTRNFYMNWKLHLALEWYSVGSK